MTTDFTWGMIVGVFFAASFWFGTKLYDWMHK